MGMIDVWKGALTDPRKSFASEKKKAGITEGAKHIAVPAVIVGALFGLIALLFSAFLSAIPGLSWFAALGVAAVIILPIIFVILWLVASLVWAGVLQVVGGVFGGKGNFEQMFYVNAIFGAPLSLLSMVIPVLGGIVAFLLQFLLQLYGWYLAVLAIKEVQQLETFKAIIVLLVSVVVLVVLLFLPLMLLFALGSAARP